MRTSTVLLAIFGLGLSAVVGWGIWAETTEADSGVITGKEYEPSTITMQCGSYNPNGICATWIPIVHPECWRIDFSDRGRRGDACVSADAFQRYQVGQRYPGGGR